MHARILTVTLNPALDKTVFVPGFCAGREFRAARAAVTAGGKGINVSRALARLGVPTLATGLIGGGSGDEVADRLKAEGIAHRFFPVRGETRTNLTIVDPESGRVTRIVERGPAVSARERTGFKRYFASLLEGSSLAVFSGSLPAGVPDGFYRDLIRMTNKRKIRAVLDTSGGAFLAGLAGRPFMIKPNREEATAVLGMRFGSRAKAARAVRRLHERGIEIVCISLGRDGAFVSRAGDEFLAAPPPVRHGRRVGCGDAFLAGFLSVWCRRHDLREAARIASAAGAANALAGQPGDIEPAVVRKFARRVRLEPWEASGC